MTLRPEYSLGHSKYNDFLFATVAIERHGIDTDGNALTVLSALTRLQVDPWHEAARLANLPPDAASRALAATFARLPDLNWKADDAAAVAQRLVALLPSSAVGEIPLTAEAAADRKAASGRAAPPPAAGPGTKPASAKPGWNRWLVWAALAVAALFVATQLQPDNNFEPPRSETVRQ
ncbi:MAG: hypothetical protein KIT25_19605 [Enhydrobacter sp.]|nr:MAG: hypothetical protein KIT25_19605 [Enhydrobacter sp.]